MAFRNPLQELLSSKRFLVIDGALATELEARGCDLRHELWSAKVLLESPESIFNTHLDYFNAGADVAITASYQASVKGLFGKQVNGRTLTEADAIDVIRSSVTIAQDARIHADPQSTRKLLIAGSVGPYGAYLADGSEYRGDYSISEAEMNDFHRPRIKALLEGGVDLLACETLPSLNEIKALQRLLQDEFPLAAAWFSVTIQDDKTLSDGTALKDVCELLETSSQVIAIGVNCIPAAAVSATLRHMAAFTSKPLLAYPNSGEEWDSKNHAWHGKSMERGQLPNLVHEWHEAGARLIGGCCRTSPHHTSIIATLSLT